MYAYFEMIIGCLQDQVGLTIGLVTSSVFRLAASPSKAIQSLCFIKTTFVELRGPLGALRCPLYHLAHPHVAVRKGLLVDAAVVGA